MKRTKKRFYALLLLLWLSAAGSAMPQTTGTLEGMVFDPSGLAVAGVDIRIVEINTGAPRRLSTDDGGRYLAPGLSPGRYRIKIAHPGFSGETRESVVLAAGSSVHVDFHLKMGRTQEQIEVMSELPLLSTNTVDWGGSIERRQLESLPMSRRDLFDLSAQTPGAAIIGVAKNTLIYGPGMHLSVNGNRPNQNSFRLDGVYINDAISMAPASAAGRLSGVEGIEELRVVSSPFSAEYGRAAGAMVTAVSKSGSNKFHGSAYEFLRNSRLDAKNYFDPADMKIPPLRKNQFGGSISGPLRTNRLFFFANYEGIRLTAGKTERPNTLTEEARQGRLPSPSGMMVVPVAPQVKPYLDLLPLPNGEDFGDGTAEYRSEVQTRTREDLVAGRIDYVPSEKLRFFGRYTFDDADTSTPEPYHIWTLSSDSRYQFLQLDTSYIPSPNTIHAFRVGFSRIRNYNSSKVRPDVPESLSFIPGEPLGVMNIVGLSAFGGTEARTRPREHTTVDYQPSYDGTHIRGAHTIRFGISYDRIQFNQRSDNNKIGFYRFDSIADFLQAKSSSGELMMPGSDTTRGWRQNQFGAFLQDEYRVRRNLAMTLGVRYEAYTTPSEVNNKIATIPDLVHDTEVTVGGALFENPSAANFAPRAAIAWDPFGSGKTVVRAGAGIFFELLGMREVSIAGARMPPFYNRGIISKASFPNLPEAAANARIVIAPDGLDFHPSQPYTGQYQLSVEQAAGMNMVLRLSYVGMRGIHLPGMVGNANPTRPTYLDDGTPYFPSGAPRVNPAWGRVGMRRMEFNSFHHALHIEVRRRWSEQWGFQAAYTFSKTIDETSSTQQEDYLNSDQIPTVSYRQNRGLADFDVRHLFSSNLSYRMPDLGRAAIQRILGGWELLGIVQLQSGHPFSPSIGFDRARVNPGGNDLGQRPDWIGTQGMKLILGNPQKYFNDLAFGLPQAGRYGNLGRNVLTGPGVVNIDVALHKDILRTAIHTVRFQLEAFNVANHPNFQIPSGLALFDGNLQRLGTAGRITATSTPSRQIQIAFKWTF
ncbi:MAG: TonB-dependent receptor [Acidobacteria bacterium]|nr:TonB-dependent receptor [Acidobacteriota bacterium]